MKKSTIWVIVVIAVVVAGVWWFQKGGSVPDLYGPSSSVSPSVSVFPKITPKTVYKATPKPASNLSYNQALALYGAKRIQFDNDCRANPATPVFKNGVSIMIDNRASVARKITIGGVAHNIGAYSFAIVKLTSPTLPKTFNVNCDSLVNSAQILLQASIGGAL